MRVEHTGYAVPGWGEGELWMRNGVVLAHEFAFKPVSDTGVVSAGGSSRRDTSAVGVPWHQVSVADAVSACGDIDTELAQVALDTKPCLTSGALVERFAAFFAGEDARLGDVPLDLDGSTPFQHAVAAALRAVPRGEVVSYGELAALAGYRGAARAVGTFCAHNRFMLLVPCHRVVGAQGMGGYGAAGTGVKRRLLALEGVVL